MGRPSVRELRTQSPVRGAVTIIGAWPQSIDGTINSGHLENEDSFHEILIHSGQHHDGNESPVFCDEFEIADAYRNLGVGSGHGGPPAGWMLEGIETLLLDFRSDGCLIYRDTKAWLARALVAVKPMNFDRTRPHRSGLIRAQHAG